MRGLFELLLELLGFTLPDSRRGCFFWLVLVLIALIGLAIFWPG